MIATTGLLDWQKRVQANFSQTALKEHELTEIWALTVAMWKEELKKYAFIFVIVVIRQIF